MAKSFKQIDLGQALRIEVEKGVYDDVLRIPKQLKKYFAPEERLANLAYQGLSVLSSSCRARSPFRLALATGMKSSRTLSLVVSRRKDGTVVIESLNVQDTKPSRARSQRSDSKARPRKIRSVAKASPRESQYSVKPGIPSVS